METNLWFTSDHHFGHKNIIKFSNRPFEDIDHMNAELVKRWNEKVKLTDTVYHIGDFGLVSAGKLREILGQLNGEIHLVTGNHESTALQCADCFASVKDYRELVVDDKEARGGKRLIVLFHYAMRVWNASHHGSWHLYGHSHGSLPDDVTSLSFDVGVDCHDFYPISYAEVKTIMSRKNWMPPFGPRD